MGCHWRDRGGQTKDGLKMWAEKQARFSASSMGPPFRSPGALATPISSNLIPSWPSVKQRGQVVEWWGQRGFCGELGMRTAS